MKNDEDAGYRQMFCFQCQQTEKGIGCTIEGVCGKKPETAAEQDRLTCEMISLASAMQIKGFYLIPPQELNNITELIIFGLFICITNVNFNTGKIAAVTDEVKSMREKLGSGMVIKPEELFCGDKDICSLRSTLLFGMRGMAAYAHHARILGKHDNDVDFWFLKGMAALGQKHTIYEWLDLLMEFGSINLKCMEALDAANTANYGHPVPVRVPLKIEKGPFIVVTGHNLHDLQMLLEQTGGEGVNIYTHGEMLPAHGYPELKKHHHLKGHFGTAWQNQQIEFNNIPAPVLFTSNCLMPPSESYSDKVYTSSVVQFPGMTHIDEDSNGNKDFTVIIEHAKNLGGYPAEIHLTGMNGGSTMTTGFGRQTVLDNMAAIIDAVKTGAIKHFFLVGGCDGAQSKRGYYTDFVKQTPKNSLIFTLACGKFRFNDLDAGSIGPFPRILDMGQCNDFYGAVKTAAALAEAFKCGLNGIPLTLVLSWYEQKAVCVLLTLLSLGIKNIYIGPSVPAFFSDNVLNILIDKFKLKFISTPENDLNQILNR